VTALLLDTHALVWLASGSARLGTRARKAIAAAAREDAVFVAAISAWEIGMLVARGRLALDRDVGEWLDQVLALPGLSLAALSPAIAVASTRLPGDLGELPADPADRMIVATARQLGARLVTADQALLAYADTGHLRALPAGR
jgi:PIN domain nuclease of toxin-antitoxin system